jgi:saccharopine dehydrogenase-like NADP-dependent oxidoreductase
MMAKAVLEILTKFNDSKITVASNILEQAEQLAKAYPKHTNAAFVDIFNVSQLVTIFSTNNSAPL